jgi:hypothetical protein
MFQAWPGAAGGVNWNTAPPKTALLAAPYKTPFGPAIRFVGETGAPKSNNVANADWA